MTLKAVVEKLDDVPENFRDEYTEKDGKFYLDVDESFRTHHAVSPLANALATLKTEKKDLQTKLNTATAKLTGLPEDFDPSKYDDLVTELETLKKDPKNRDKDVEEGLARQREQYEQRIRDAEAKRVADLEAKDEVIASKDRKIEKLVVGDGLTKALVGAGVGPEYLRAAEALLRPQVKLRVDEAHDVEEAVVDTDLGEVTVAKYVETWSQGAEGKPFVVKPAGGGSLGGGGANGRSSEVNPWAKDTTNLTKQGEIIRSDRAKARRLMAAAGVPEAKISATLG